MNGITKTQHNRVSLRKEDHVKNLHNNSACEITGETCSKYGRKGASFLGKFIRVYSNLYRNGIERHQQHHTSSEVFQDIFAMIVAQRTRANCSSKRSLTGGRSKRPILQATFNEEVVLVNIVWFLLTIWISHGRVLSHSDQIHWNFQLVCNNLTHLQKVKSMLFNIA